MPFGAQYQEGVGVRFQLWAPSRDRVWLCTPGERDERQQQMECQEGGWHRLDLAEVRPGQRYWFRFDDTLRLPDPASRFNPDDVHGASEVIDPAHYRWQDSQWRGRPWHEAVMYELHIGTFTPEGTFRAALQRLDYLVDLGITAIELMPVAEFPGSRDWGYDGVLLFAPESSYGRPEDLKALVDGAHQRGLMVLLDVVYNHFGPEGNYLPLYAKELFTDSHATPWGAAINFDGENSRPVRDLYVHNVLYWLTEYHLDGLRFDAVHAIADDSNPDILEEIANTVRTAFPTDRHIHLILENDKNAARYLGREEGRASRYTAQWNDDIHHAWHVLVTGERDGYYVDYADDPAQHLARCLAEGFDYQGNPSPYRDGEERGERSGHLPPQAFISFLQNHDQVGNRAFGERLSMLVAQESLRPAIAAMLLAPSPPLLFMGEEFGANTPFLFFCDFGPDLRDAVRDGRRREFTRFARFNNPAGEAAIPDPGDVATFESSKLNWASLEHDPHLNWLVFYKKLLHLRAVHIVPRAEGARASGAARLAPGAVRAHWTMNDGSLLVLLTNLGDGPVKVAPLRSNQCLYAYPAAAAEAVADATLPARSTVWSRAS